MSRQETDEHKRWVECIKTEGCRLTPWEEQFVSDIGDRLDSGYTLSDRQVEILERIYAEKTP